MNAEAIKTSTTATTDRETLTAKIRRFAATPATPTPKEIAAAYNLSAAEILSRRDSMSAEEITAAVARQAARRNLSAFADDGEIITVDYALMDTPVHLLRRKVAAVLNTTADSNDPDSVTESVETAAAMVQKFAVPVRVTLGDALTPARVWRNVKEVMMRVRWNAKVAANDYLSDPDNLTPEEIDAVELAAVALTINNENAHRAHAEKENAKAISAIDWDNLTPDQIAQIRAMLG